MLIVSDIHFFIFSIEDGHQGGELFFRGAGEIPVNERIVGILLEQIPGDQTAGIDEVSFKVGMFCHFLIVEGRWGEDIKILQTTALQQFSHGTLQRNAEIRVCAEGGKAGTVGRVEQDNANHRILAAQRAIVGKNWETFRFQCGDGLHHCRIARHHLGRDFRQADAFGDNTVLHMALKDFRQTLNASFVRCVTRRHAVRNIQVADNIHRNVDGLVIRLAGKRQATDATFFITRL